MRATKDKYKRHQYQRQLRQLKSLKRRKAWLKAKRKYFQGKSASQREFYETKRQATPVDAPSVFSIKQNPNKVFQFIALLKSFRLKKQVKAVFISLKDCTYISNGAVALMISVIKELKSFNIKVSGSYPDDKPTRAILEKSGFFDFVIGNVSEENRVTPNTILQQGTDVVDSEIITPLVLKSMKFLYGKPYRNQRIQSLLIELMANTVNHAFAVNKTSKWYLSISPDEENKKVMFTFIDNGQGISNTLNLKFFDKIASLFLGSNGQILQAAFDGKFGSRTKERKRGRGLPSIKKCFTENFISNLVVITNNVFLDFKSNETQLLDYNFDGTCYYWELDLNCVQWNIL